MRNLSRGVLYLVVFGFLAFVDFRWINPANQTYAKRYLNASIALSAGTYATCRLINGGISSIQESSISISPWGIGLEFEAGQILDPINDATERLSDACVKSMALLGTQRLLLAIVNTYTVLPFYLLLGGFLITLPFAQFPTLTTLLGKGALLLLLLRLTTPILCLAGTAANDRYFAPQINTQQTRLAEVKHIAQKEFEFEIPVLTSISRSSGGRFDEIIYFFTDFRNRIITVSANMKHRIASLSEAIKYLKANFGEVSRSLAMLFVLVIEKIFVQVFLLPLTLLYLLKKLFSALTGENLNQFVARAKALPLPEQPPRTQYDRLQP